MEITGKSSTGLPENVAALLCYLLGFVTGLLFMIIEKESPFVRFHAMQSFVTFLGLFLLSGLCAFIPVFGWLVGLLLVPLNMILWVFLMYKAFQGERFKLPVAGDIAEKQLGNLPPIG